jgi:acetyl esterase
MSTRALVDPEVLPIIDLLPLMDMTLENLSEARVQLSERPSDAPPPAMIPETHFATGRDGAPGVKLLVYNPPSENRSRGAILHIHGGGMVLGNAEMSLMTAPPIALAHDLVIVSVDYRLAPEAPFPGPQEDCYAGLAWLIAHAVELGVDPARVMVMGESAGGGLAAALAQMVRDRGEYRLSAQILFYPMLDHRVGGPDCPYGNPVTGEFIWTKGRNQFGWSCLRGDYALNDDRIGWFSPARASDVAGLPPTYIAIGALDLFLDEDLDYARRLAAAGVPCELHLYPGAIHAFNMVPTAAVAQQANRDLMEGIGRLALGKAG